MRPPGRARTASDAGVAAGAGVWISRRMDLGEPRGAAAGRGRRNGVVVAAWMTRRRETRTRWTRAGSNPAGWFASASGFRTRRRGGEGVTVRRARVGGSRSPHRGDERGDGSRAVGSRANDEVGFGRGGADVRVSSARANHASTGASIGRRVGESRSRAVSRRHPTSAREAADLFASSASSSSAPEDAGGPASSRQSSRSSRLSHELVERCVMWREVRKGRAKAR